jgi:hypothetical protein
MLPTRALLAGSRSELRIVWEAGCALLEGQLEGVRHGGDGAVEADQHQRLDELLLGPAVSELVPEAARAYRVICW